MRGMAIAAPDPSKYHAWSLLDRPIVGEPLVDQPRQRRGLVQGEHGQIHSLEEKPLPTMAPERYPKIHAHSKVLQPKLPQLLTCTVIVLIL